MLKTYNLSITAFRKVVFILLCGILLSAPNLKGELVLNDPFHHGEFIATAVNLFSEEPQGFSTLKIHGALDFIPALVARSVWNEENYFLPTLAIYNSLTILANLFFIAITFILTNGLKHKWKFLIASALTAPVIVGYRDLFLLSSLYVFIKTQKDTSNKSLNLFYLVLLGVSMSLGAFWSFDRGLAGIISIGIGTIIASIKKPTKLISIISFIGFSVYLSTNFSQFSFDDYFENIRVLIQTSSQWSYERNYDTLSRSVFALAINFLSAILLLHTAVTTPWSIERTATYTTLLALSVFMFKIGINRADYQHIYYSLWTPMLSAFAANQSSGKYPRIIEFLAGSLVLMTLALAFRTNTLLISAVIYITTTSQSEKLKNLASIRIFVIATTLSALSFSHSTIRSIINKDYIWLNNIIVPPSNFAASTQGVQWVSKHLLEANPKCIFDLSNNGTINGLTNLPSCSRFIYPVYAGSMHQDELIDSLVKASPTAIVYSTTYWSYAIDGKSMQERFPALDRFIRLKYPKEKCAHGYCIRYLRSLNEK